MNHLQYLILFVVASIPLVAGLPAVADLYEESQMEALSEAKGVLTEMWCVDGYRVLYVEKISNGTFQFFQVSQNAGIAIKAIECKGDEVRIIE